MSSTTKQPGRGRLLPCPLCCTVVYHGTTMTASSTYPSRRSLRLRTYDYAQAGAYFVTICTEGRVNRFGHIRDGTMLLNPLGQLVADTWAGLDERFGVGIDAFVVMPNHLHGVLVHSGRARSSVSPGSFASTHGEPAPSGVLAGKDNVATPGGSGLSLSEVVRRFKTYTANQARRVGDHEHQLAGVELWQRNFYERVIRNDRELDAIREYIANNPLQWHLDRENPER